MQGETVAIVPGAFKPPHMGHVDMVEQYAEDADRSYHFIFQRPTDT